MFPERDSGCAFIVHEENDDDLTQCKRPLGLVQNSIGLETLTGLMPLNTFVDGGYEAQNAKVLVCVRSLGVGKKGLLRMN